MHGTYSAGSLLRYFRHCKANPDSKVLLPGGDPRWEPDTMAASDWLSWFSDCLQRKVSRGTEGKGKGNRAAKRLQAIRDRKATCKWCGQLTGSTRKWFCDQYCFRGYHA